MHPLEVDGTTLREMLRATGKKLAGFVDGLPSQSVSRLDGSARVARRAMEPCPTEPTPFGRLLSEVVDHLTPTSLNTASPGYLGFIPGGGLPDAAVADLISGVLNRYTGLWLPAPGWVQLETSVIRWMCAWVGYGEDAGGQLLSGGSLANMVALVAARDAGATCVYATALTHHCVAKAAHIVGLPVVEVAMDAGHRMRADALPHAPGVVVASAGTTALGTVDPLEALADACEAGGHWLHVDGAYGGCFALTARGKAVLQGMARADSIVLDPHKGLFLPYGTGAVLVRDRMVLRRAFSSDSDYLPDPQEDPDRWDFADMGPELSRPARGLRLWLPLKLHGVGAFVDALDEKLDLAADAAARIRDLPHVRMVAGPALSLFAFRVEPPGVADLDRLNRRILSLVNDAQRVFLTGAWIHEAGVRVFVQRVCVLSFRTHAERIDMLVADMAGAIDTAIRETTIRDAGSA